VSSPPADPPVLREAGTDRPLDAASIRAGLGRCDRVIARHARHLTRLDAVLGDGDHGDNLVIGFRAVSDLLAELAVATPPGEIMGAVGHRLVAAVGGASGPLYGTACIEAGFVAGRSTVLDGPVLAAMFRAAAAGLARRGRCQPGDKTILDTLAPAAEAFGRAIEAGESVPAAYGAAVRAGRVGMRSTRDLVARRGLALRLGDRSVGHRDPGAVSCLLLLVALGRR
jgi:dihydroxyacetone kinase-like protein